MDFSEGERSGFIDAFVQFWMMRMDNTRTAGELNEAAKAILRGCEEHFRAAVTKVSRINGAVGPDKVAAFKARALGLLSVPDIEEFNKQVGLRTVRITGTAVGLTAVNAVSKIKTVRVTQKR